MNIFTLGLTYFAKGGWVMYPLLLCSIYTIAIGLERYRFYRQADSGDAFVRQFCSYVAEARWSEAQDLATQTRGEQAKLATIVLARHERFEYLENFVATRAERALDAFERHLASLQVVVTLAPVLGLLGTITGMISSFNALNERAQNPLAVTAGIGEALITTVFGLCISIVALCLASYFGQRLKHLTLCVEEMSNTLLEAVAQKQEASRAQGEQHD